MSSGVSALHSHSTKGLEIVSSLSDRVKHITILVLHLNGEGLSVPRINGPDSSIQHQSSGQWVEVIAIESSPE